MRRMFGLNLDEFKGEEMMEEEAIGVLAEGLKAEAGGSVL